MITPSGTTNAPGGSLPGQLSLAPVAPNPLHGGGVFSYALPLDGPVLVAIYDAAGRQVRVLAGGTQACTEPATSPGGPRG